jgi:Holliday junction resolvase-like predicted endonuclease
MTGASPRSAARDLRIRVGPDQKKISHELASALASYFKELLPTQIPVAAVLFHDRIQRENELVRLHKGRWENYIRDFLAQTGRKFVKRRFRIGKKTIEIDAVYPAGDHPKVAIDIKRIEAMEDYQKRTDEINAKARELKSVCKVVFLACIFFPFAEKKHMVLNRLDRTVVDHVYFQDEVTRMLNDIQAI